METILRSIRTDLRLSMNGAVAASIRKMGVNYRVIFGVDIMRLKELSCKYERSKALAERLWSEDVRELKIMATMLFPPDDMTLETANRWAEQISNQELREQVCKNLFEKLSFADKAAEEWSVSNDEGIRTTGYWLFARLCISSSKVVDNIDSIKVLSRAVGDLQEASPLLYQSALNALRFFGRIDRQRAEWVLREVSSLESSNSQRSKEMFDQLKHEFDR